MNNFFKHYGVHFLAVLAFLLLSLAYNTPLLEGKKLKQEDMTQVVGMTKELKDYHQKTGKIALWTNALFCGMPAYQIYAPKPGMLVEHISTLLTNAIPQPASFFLLLMFCFYLLLVALGMQTWLALAGSIAFAFSSYNVIILDVGHVTKAMAIAYMAPVFGGLVLLFRKKYASGFGLFAMSLALELYANHIQVTYYMAFALLIMAVSYGILAIKEKAFLHLAKVMGLATLAGILALGANYTNLAITYEYSKETMRGNSELKALEQNSAGAGLDKDYAFSWSYGIAETATLLIPNFYGGSSTNNIGTKSETYRVLTSGGVPQAQATSFVSNAPTYFGDQPFTAGPTYFGAIIVFLFVFAMLVLPNADRWWMLAAVLLACMMAWGRNFDSFASFLFDYLPLYNKFRAVAMALVVASLVMPLAAIMGLNRVLKGELLNEQLAKALKTATAITAGFCLIFTIAPGIFLSFDASVDANFNNFPGLADALQADRAALVKADALRSLVFILLAAALIWFGIIKHSFDKKYVLPALFLLILIDLWVVDKRYLNADDFVAKRLVDQPFEPTDADRQILADPNPYFRVLNTSLATYDDNSTSYFHKSIGGYHAAKLSRFEDIKIRHLIKGNMAVVNMLNGKYIITKGEDGRVRAQRNPGAMGNAWFVNEAIFVENALAEIDSLTNFDPSTQAFVDKRFAAAFPQTSFEVLPDDNIELLAYSPDTLRYTYQASSTQMVVFSEMYYDKGWNAYVDGKPATYFRANYALRAMIVAPGTHQIEFRFEPKTYYQGEKIALGSSIALFLTVAGAAFMALRKPKHIA